MARMYPRPIPQGILSEPRRSSEVRMYEALDRALDDRYVVAYGVAWLTSPPTRPPRDGETDFIILHPDLGVLVMELKGGRVARDGVTGKWASMDRSGGVHAIDDPFAQARGSKYALIEKVKAHPSWGNRWIEIGHSVALPDCARPAVPLSPDGPVEILFTAEDFADPRRRVEAIYAWWKGREQHPFRLGPDGVEILVKLLAPTFELRRPLGIVLAEQDREILHLTEQQFRVLDVLKRQRRVAVSGGAGTGKTFLAVEKAKRLAAEGFHVLLTCFNRPLAEFLSRSVGRTERLDVLTFHQLCYARAREAGIPLAYAGESDAPAEYFEQTLPEALLSALDKTAQRYDAIVVDEGQDFRARWWEPLQFCLADPSDGILYVFHDDNQMIYQRHASFPKGLQEACLTENLRNTRTIHGEASRFYKGGELVPLGPAGKPVEVVQAPSRDKVESEVSRVLHRLLREERIPADQVAILTGTSLEKTVIARHGRIGAFSTTHDQDADPEKVLLETIHRFKGLERPVVVLADIEGLLDAEATELLYVGLTRARGHLVIVATSPTLQRHGLRR